MDGILNEIVVDLDFGCFKVNPAKLKRFPLTEGLTDGFTCRAFWQEAPGEVRPLQHSVHPSTDGRALTSAIEISQRPTTR
jgi:hypothetical protein